MPKKVRDHFTSFTMRYRFLIENSKRMISKYPWFCVRLDNTRFATKLRVRRVQFDNLNPILPLAVIYSWQARQFLPSARQRWFIGIYDLSMLLHLPESKNKQILLRITFSSERTKCATRTNFLQQCSICLYLFIRLIKLKCTETVRMRDHRYQRRHDERQRCTFCVTAADRYERSHREEKSLLIRHREIAVIKLITGKV
jgi:hypothetical protein